MRAPPELLMPMQGTPMRSARSMTLTIFSAKTSPSDPPNTVKSCEKMQTGRPSIVPWPVITPSPSGWRLVHAKAMGAMHRKCIQLHERAGIEQRINALAGGAFTALVLLFGGGRIAVGRLLAPAPKLFNFLLRGSHTTSLFTGRQTTAPWPRLPQQCV